MKKINHKVAKKKWLLYSVIGLLLLGAGLSMAIDAGFAKANGETWIFYGTISLAIFNAGVCFVVEGGLWKMRLEKED